MRDPGTRLHPDRGWWIKFDRAQEHLIELFEATATYKATREYRVAGKVESKKRVREWVYRVWLDREPDQSWCLLVGDCLFNLTCALDHLAVALNPPQRKNDLIYFPSYVEDPWRRQGGTRRYIERDPTNRQRFASSTRDMLPEARTFIEQAQPYAAAQTMGEDANYHTLVLLHRFHVTDKHRRLLAVGHGTQSGVLTWTHPKTGVPTSEVYVFPPDALAKDGAVIKRLRFKVEMKFVGALSVAFARSEPRQTKLGLGPFLGLDSLPLLSDTVEDRLFALEPYVQW